MFRFPHFSPYGLIAVPIVLLLVWLFNAYRMGRFRKPPEAAANTGVDRNKPYRTLLLCGAVLVLVIIALVIGFGK